MKSRRYGNGKKMIKKAHSAKGSDKGVKKIRVLIVDRHPALRSGVREALKADGSVDVIGEADSFDQAVGIISKEKPELIIMDISLNGRSGLDLLKYVQESAYAARCFIYTSQSDVFSAERALKAGAMGYSMKSEPLEVLLTGIRSVCSGNLYVSDDLKDRLLRRFMDPQKNGNGRPSVDRLSDREVEVFELIGRGFGTREIADQLSLSVKTIETYRGHIKRKLKVASASELLRAAIDWVSIH